MEADIDAEDQAERDAQKGNKEPFLVSSQSVRAKTAVAAHDGGLRSAVCLLPPSTLFGTGTQLSESELGQHPCRSHYYTAMPLSTDSFITQ